MPSRNAAQTLGEVAAALPSGGEDRPGQTAMAQAVERAIDLGRHLVVEAGTGTGKSLAYLVPAITSGRTVVVATATKALQDQLAQKDLPFLVDQLGERRAFSFAVLKGRSNYLCRQKATEMMGGSGSPPTSSGSDSDTQRSPEATFFQTDLFATEDEPGTAPTMSRSLTAIAAPDVSSSAASGGSTLSAGVARLLGESAVADGLGDQARRILAWAEGLASDPDATGDRAELEFEPNARVWGMLSVTARECPGPYRCPSGSVCFAERARSKAAEADVVVVNTHLYATHVKSKGTVLPDHQVVVFDEAHAVEDIMAAGLGVEMAAGRLRALAQSARALVAPDEVGLCDGLNDSADHLDAILRLLAGQRVFTTAPRSGDSRRPPVATPGDPEELRHLLELARGRVAAVIGALGRAGREDDDGPSDRGAALKARAMLAAGHLAEDLDVVTRIDDDHVAWVESSGPGGRIGTLRVAPIDVGPTLAGELWPEVTAILTSATVPPLLEERLGLPKAETDRVDVGSPFPFERNAVLYCASHLPDPRKGDATAKMHAEIVDLARAAGGRTLALFTSWRAMDAAAAAISPLLPYRVLTQNELPKARLIEAFAQDESSCLFATMSFWQGVDVPGSTLSLVVVDKLPFARPDDPLIDARRQRAGEQAFRVVDLPRAATLLAQGAGRLIRSATDTGVVAVLDPRLVTAGYGRDLRAALPPMRFTTKKAEVVEFLEAIDARLTTVS